LAFRRAIGEVATVSPNFVTVSMAHSCSRRLTAYQKGTMHGRRLSDTVTVTYTILLPSNKVGRTIANLLTSKSNDVWTTMLEDKLALMTAKFEESHSAGVRLAHPAPLR